ncbi:hypothetical protein EBBID32_46130 [Sphingobium indicum BiD32]|uniref:Glycoside hydrolase family 5 domain-containing protein n=1 Tax=Sphingobium indicum BiD32 TaxID=1301087 RepID=N1MU14_9SPHN|nr:hypothetical protein [Sphingobium indicum]CCW20239.1 hypothetical protein EBBID32_46130 [Sphingobium indicum BiD32]
MGHKPKVGCHYFFGNSPLNFWSNLDTESIKAGIDYVKSTGFSSIFLLVPWAEFVSDKNNEIAIQSYCAENYRAIVQECLDAGLDMHVRVAYLWEARPAGSKSFTRYEEFFSNSLHQSSLATLCRFLSDVERNIGGNIKYFFSWEDAYWPMFSFWRSRSIEDRRHLAEVTGFKAFLRLQGIWVDENTLIPRENESNFLNFCQFYDCIILSNILKIMHGELGKIGMEYRIDSDFVEDDGEYKKHFHWPLCHPWVTQKYVYYHPNVFGFSENQLSAEESNERLKWVIRTAAPRLHENERPLILDQFNFIDNTEVGWATTGGEQIDEFMRLAAQETRERGVELALWTTIDWPRDVVFNGSFKLGLEGWEFNGPEPRIEYADGKGIVLDGGSHITQNPPLSFPKDNGFHVYIELFCRTDEAILSIRTSHEHIENVSLSKGFHKIDQTLQIYNEFITVGCNFGSIFIKNIKMYDRFYSQGGRISEDEEGYTFGYFKKHFLE